MKLKFHHAIRKFMPKPIRDRGYSAVASLLHRFGFIPRVTAGPVCFRGLDIEPAEAIKRAAGLPCMIDVEPDHLRNVGPVNEVAYFPCQRNSGNPFVDTIIQYLSNRDLVYDFSILQRYYVGFQPKTVAEALGIAEEDDLHFLMRQPALLTFPPWARPPLDDYETHLKRRQNNISIENHAAGGKFDCRHGYSGFGPVSKVKGAWEFNRLIRVANSIIANGYHIQSGMDAVQAVVLRSGQEYRFICANGHHRTSALAALNYDKIPVSLHTKIIDRDDILDWPGVTASVFTPDQALQIFDMFFNGTPPEAALRWWRDMQSVGVDKSLARPDPV